MSVKSIMDDLRSKMEKALEVMEDSLKSVRTGRAGTGLVEGIMIDYYGSHTPLRQLANLAAPESNMIVIKPFDPSCLGAIEKAIKASDLSIAPMVEGRMIRLNVPALSEERRRDIVGQVKQLGEQAKVSVRNIRRDGNKELEKEEKEKIITEDDLDLGKKQIDELTKEISELIDSEVKKKSAEIMED